MNIYKLIIRNLKYFKKEHLLLFFGLVLSTAILTSALIIGDSVKFSLNNIVEKRLGKTQQIVITQEKFFPSAFAKTLSKELNLNIAPILKLRGMASSDNSDQSAPDVQLCGVDKRFWDIGNCEMPYLNDNEVIINSKLANKLHLKIGEELFIRVEKVSFVTENAPFVPTENNSNALRMKIKAIADEYQFGNFDIQSNQITPFTIYFSITKLSSLNFKGSFANMMLISKNEKSIEAINSAIKKCWTIDVINLKIRPITKQNKFELSSDKVFIEDSILHILRKNNLNPEPHFTYLINFISANNKVTPYSFVSALSHYPGYKLKNNEIIINSWLADDLGVSLNDTISLQYFTLETFRKLEEKTSKFIVKHIIEIKGFAADSLLMPAFEGLTGVDKCSDWEAGVPVDYSKIRDKDEAWWKKHKGTPKAFINYEKAIELWGMSFGNSTSIRFDNQTDTTKIKDAILKNLQPANVGLNVFDIKNNSTWSASNAVDFSQLFLGLSFFLILAAFLLSGLLFSMMIVQRKKEQGIYLSIGLTRQLIYKLFFAEGVFNALISSFVGVFVGIIFSQLILFFLNSIWFDIVRTSSILLYINPISLIIGFLSNIVISSIVIFLILKSHFKKQINELNRNANSKQFIEIQRNRKISFLTGIISALAIITFTIFSFQNNLNQNSTIFFILGFLLLISLSAWFAFYLLKSNNSFASNINYTYLAIRNLKYDYKRNILITSILSIGIFIVISTGANRADFKRNANNNSSGTGGYTFFIETNLAINADLSTSEARDKLGINDNYNDLTFVQLLRNKNDDASCLNLNRIIQPSILGVKTTEFSKRKSFFFVNSLNDSNLSWEILNHPMAGNCIPAICDQTVITWGLGKMLGDSIMYTNEKGKTIYLVLVGALESSIFQGNIIISQKEFEKHFPSISGSNFILADVANNQSAELNENLENALKNYGAKIEIATERLATFNSVTNTYLDIFLALGGIALILGTFGIAIVLIRSINSRESNYAMMQAFGISQRNIRKIIIIEFSIILFVGISIGLVAAITSSFQSLIANNADVPYLLLISIVLLFTVNGLAWIILGSKMSIKKNFITNLRNE